MKELCKENIEIFSGKWNFHFDFHKKKKGLNYEEYIYIDKGKIEKIEKSTSGLQC